MTDRLVMPVDSSVDLADRHALDQVLEGDRALDLGEDRAGVRIPLGETLAALHLVAVVDEQSRTVGDAVHDALAAVGIEDGDGEVTRHDHQLAVGVLDDVAVANLDGAVEVRLDEGLIDHLCRSTDVEGTHRELGARLADRLGRDDADRLADVHRRAAGQIAPVALAANAKSRFTGEHRTNAGRLDVCLLDPLDIALVDELAGLDDYLAGRRLREVF